MGKHGTSGTNWPTAIDTACTEVDLGTVARAAVPNDISQAVVEMQKSMSTGAANGLFVWSATYSTFGDAITVANSSGKTLVISTSVNLPAGSVSITSPVLFLGGGVINKSAATSLSIPKIEGNPTHQIFSGFAASQLLGLKKAKVEWFGAVGDGTTDDSVALQLAFDWLTYSSNRKLKMKGKYRANSMLSLYALQAVENSRNCILDAYGAVIESYVNGTAVHIGKNGEEVRSSPAEQPDTNQTARFQYNTVKGLRIQAMVTTVHTLLRIGGQYSYSCWYKDISLFGIFISPSTRTKQGLLFFGRNNYYNYFTNLHVENCDYAIMNGKDMNDNTYLSSTEPSNANKINGALLYNVGVYGIGLYVTAGNRFTNIDMEGGSSATSCRDVYFGNGATDNVVSARHERVNYNLTTGPYTHEFSTTSPTPTGNTAESNLHLVVKDSAVAGYNPVIADNILIKLSSTNNGYDVNHLKSRFIYNPTDQPISIRQNQFNGGEDAIMVNSGGVHLTNLILPVSAGITNATDAGLEGRIVWSSNYIYVCIAPDTWKRVAIATWP